MNDGELYAGDYGYNVNFFLKNYDGTVFDLTGLNLAIFSVQLAGQTIVKFSGNMSLASLPLGKLEYTVQPTDFDIAGQYTCQITLSISGAQITFNDKIINILQVLPK